MMLQRILVIAGTLGTCACAVAVQSSRPKDLPREALTRAIEQAGGAEALTRATALEWEGVASVHAANRDVSIAGNWEVQPPDSALVTTYEVSQGPATERALVLASLRGDGSSAVTSSRRCRRRCSRASVPSSTSTN